MSYKQYKPEELKKLQRLSSSILEELDRVCRILNIPYFIYAGTAIGAVRHGGFIPWDDDIDVGMLRKDYERFLKEAPSVLGSAFMIEDYHSDPYFPACDSNLALKDTYCVPEEFENCPFQYAISIGLYAFDSVTNDQKLLKKQLRKTWWYGRLVFLRATPKPHMTLKGLKKHLALAACFIAHWGMKIIHISPKWLHDQWEHWAQAGNSCDTGVYCDFTDRNPLSWSVSKEELFPLEEIEFENISVKIPHGYDTILKRGYGDYMQLPPEEDRKNHYPSRLDFGPYSD